jgi:hypothetical protein
MALFRLRTMSQRLSALTPTPASLPSKTLDACSDWGGEEDKEGERKVKKGQGTIYRGTGMAGKGVQGKRSKKEERGRKNTSSSAIVCSENVDVRTPKNLGAL